MRPCLPPTRLLGLTAAALSALALGCTGLPDDGRRSSDDGALRGELVTHILDFDEHSEFQYQLRLSNGELRRLTFSGSPELAPGTAIKVWGHDTAEGLAVTRFERDLSVPEPKQQALINGMKKPTKRWAFVLVNFGGTPTLTKEMATDRLFGLTNPRSMKNYYREVSYNLQDLDGDVLGPFDVTPRNTCDTNTPVSQITPMLTNGMYDQYLWYFQTRQAGCGWAGLASLGTADRPQRNSWYNASSGCVVLAQEPGHNFGMVHSSSMSCRDGNGTPVPIIAGGGGTCTHSEYGNQFDPMGGGCFHMDGFQKAYQNWLSGCNVVKVTQSGTFTIFPLETACNGVQLLQIPMGGARSIAMAGVTAALTSYYLELRTPVGLDAALTPRVLVTVGGEIAESRGRGGRNWLLDMTPETMTKNDAALPVGKTYSDPSDNGPKFTVVSADATKATIRVELAGGGGSPDSPGAGTCDDGTMFAAPGPANCSAAPPPIMVPDGGMTTGRDGGSADSGRSDTGAGGAGGGGGSGGTGGGTGGAGGSTPPPTYDAAPVTPPPATPDAGSQPPPPPPTGGGGPTTGGCGCRVGGTAPAQNGALLSALFLALALLRRRRQR
jgi:MYXO-CTERM domain-containing protein